MANNYNNMMTNKSSNDVTTTNTMTNNDLTRTDTATNNDMTPTMT